MTTIENLRGLILSAAELKDMTGWPDALIEDYLTIIENLVAVSEGVDTIAGDKIEDIATDFSNWSIPYAKDGKLVEDNTRLVWSILTYVLTVANIKVDGTAQLDTATASRLLSTNSSKFVTSVDNLTTWLIQTDNQVIVTDLGNGTVQLSLPQDFDTDSTPELAGIIVPVTVVEADYSVLDTDNILLVNCFERSSTVLLVQSNNAQGDTTIIDSSIYEHSITNLGAIHSETAKEFGNSSIFNTLSTSIRVPYSTDFNPVDGKFTIHGWINTKGSTSSVEILSFAFPSTSYRYWNLYAARDNQNGILGFTCYDSDGNFLQTVGSISTGRADNVLDHIAAVKGDDEVVRLYVNGVGSGTLDLTGKSIREASASSYVTSLTDSNGQSYKDELHFLKGVALWDGDFTPPIAPNYFPADDKIVTLRPGIEGRTQIIIKGDQNTGTCTIVPDGTDLIDDETSLVLTAFREIATLKFIDGMWRRMNLSNNILIDGITGTANQVIVTDDGDQTVTLSTPQDIDTDADVVFDSLTLGDMTPTYIPFFGTGGLISEIATFLWDAGLHLKADSLKMFFGAADDLSIFYDGTDANIKTDEAAASDLLLTCGANKTLELQNVVYEDLQVGMNNLAKGVTAPTDRTYDHGTGGIAYPVLGFAKNDYIWFDVQTSHSMKLNTVLDCHMHFVLPNTTTIGHKFVFQLDVMVAGIGGTWSVPAGSPFTAIHTVAADDNTKHRLLEIADIPASNTTVSSVYKCKLTRIDGEATEYSSEVYLEFIDCHYQKNTIGSRQEGAK